MLISCKSCKSKYLVNSAELKPNGRSVECSRCGNQWYQEVLIEKINDIEQKNENFISSKTEIANKKKDIQSINLPSTYVHKQKVSILNTILVILFVLILFITFIIFRNIEINTLVLLKFYVQEFILI